MIILGKYARKGAKAQLIVAIGTVYGMAPHFSWNMNTGLSNRAFAPSRAIHSNPT
jgi:hypothetical protein